MSSGIVIAAIFSIWLLLFVNVALTAAGYLYYLQCERKDKHKVLYAEGELPKVSVMVPAHNEAKVIVQTVEALLLFDYPKERYEIIVINDNSSDNSAMLLEEISRKNPERKLVIINTDHKTGGKGKSNALNIGYQRCSGEMIAIYDADNTPEKEALRYLASELYHNESLGAVIGKFRTRNKNVNLLTRFINIETLAFQWMAQAGRWKLLGLCTIPGTNFMIRKTVLDEIGGWDVKAVAEDTEISFRIYQMGLKIKFLPHAVTWEQEPQTIKVWFRQRTRWVKGNIYVLIKNVNLIFLPGTKRLKFDMCYLILIYFFLLTALLVSDLLLIGTIFGWIYLDIPGFGYAVWLMAAILFVAETFVTLTTEKGEMTFSNFLIIVLMYFTYSKLWMAVAAYGIIQYLEDVLKKREAKWYKTERF